ncbi:MAG: NADPH-dependent 7-cyano-7-deazaguanine reductase QueF [Treponema sp.]|nr:NADPH-dependent 7-cyano-7-deazaguanine reductase QueF [Treponema sp.]MBR4629895.1 NADPH-dependent 7-cyano-7-deazaguanine reductase QueF [Treponema sp.]MBR6913840.1 NADPH-dependent 7-cyano-7-deazaguanine reductase QueF [Treponema sp.]MCR5124474.1 preQ(1) synthase [Treponema sp.]
MPRSESELEGVTLLGNQSTKYTYDYNPNLLEKFPNKHPDNDYMVTLNCPEFTSLCPKTGQPDFATIRINYIPDKFIVESKSLKLYLFSFRNHGDFHEDCANIIMKDLVRLLEPKYLEVEGIFTPRGGISIYPFANYAKEGSSYEDMKKSRLFSVLDARK